MALNKNKRGRRTTMADGKIRGMGGEEANDA